MQECQQDFTFMPLSSRHPHLLRLGAADTGAEVNYGIGLYLKTGPALSCIRPVAMLSGYSESSEVDMT